MYYYHRYFENEETGLESEYLLKMPIGNFLIEANIVNFTLLDVGYFCVLLLSCVLECS